MDSETLNAIGNVAAAVLITTFDALLLLVFSVGVTVAYREIWKKR